MKKVDTYMLKQAGLTVMFTIFMVVVYAIEPVLGLNKFELIGTFAFIGIIADAMVLSSIFSGIAIGGELPGPIAAVDKGAGIFVFASAFVIAATTVILDIYVGLVASAVAVVVAGAFAVGFEKFRGYSFNKTFGFLLGNIVLIASAFFALFKGELVLGTVIIFAAIAYPLIIAGIDLALQHSGESGLFAKTGKAKIAENAKITTTC